MKKISSVNCLLGIGILVCTYILVASIFPVMRIPFSFLDEEGTMLFNNIMEGIAISYLVGVLIYYITVIVRDKKIRKLRNWELYDALKEHHKLEEFTGVRWNLFNEDHYKELTSKQVSELIEEYKRIVEVLHKYDNVLTEDELEWLHEISRDLDFEVYNSEMLPIEIEKNTDQIKEINKCIVKLQSSFIELIKH